VSALAPDQRAAIYAELFQKRWNFEVPGKAHLTEVFSLLNEFMTGSVVYLSDGQPLAIQVLYRAESPRWVSVEYINGGVDPAHQVLAAGSVLTFVNTQGAWADAAALGKSLRYSFGRADREYKDMWCHRVPVYQV
jgi:Mig-14